MKTAIQIFLLFSFLLFLPFFIFFTSVKFNGFSPQLIKTQLSDNKIYSIVIQDLNKKLDELSTNSESDDPLLLLTPMIKKEINPRYLQTKTETFIDDTNFWIAGKTNNPPVLSFKDLKDKIVAENPQFLAAINEIKEEAKEQKGAINTEKMDTTGNDINKQLDEFENFINSDMTVPIGKQMGGIKIAYDMMNKSIPIFGAVLMLLFLGIVLLAETKQSRFRWASATLFISFLWLGVLLMIFIKTPWLTDQLYTQYKKSIPDFVMPLAGSIINPLMKQMTTFGEITLAVLLLIALICFIASKAISSSSPALQTKTLPAKNTKAKSKKK